MHISSVRLGHANNSSSSHSILLGSTVPQIITCERSQFGWEWFHLRDRQWKANYLSTLILMTLTRDNRNGHGMSPEAARIIAKELTGDDPLGGIDGGDNDIGAYIDHQSIPVMPMVFGHKHHDIGFLREFADYILEHPEITIRGGNDNESEGDDDCDEDVQPDLFIQKRRIPTFDGKRHPLFSEKTDWVYKYPYDDDIAIYARKDGDWWVLYNDHSGAKIRLSFKDNPAPYIAKTPELVDLKLTNRCRQHCDFCYQDSKINGEEAKYDDIFQIVYALQKAKVFEVALGGGEPTGHPDFVRILQDIRSYGLSPNFSTGHTEWMHDEKIRAAVMENCGSFAVSDPYCIDGIIAWNETAGREHRRRVPKATLQLALGCHSEEEIKKALQAAQMFSIPVTLLGYKKFGRAANRPPIPYGWILDEITRGEHFHFGADSVFVEEFGEELKKRGVSEKLMVNQEGAHSCYIDVVGQVMGPSSFTKDLHPIDHMDIFGKFPYAQEA